jgi:hypothetical protein
MITIEGNYPEFPDGSIAAAYLPPYFSDGVRKKTVR